jgi:transcriptional regulator with XRE-family HTH domain
MHLTNGEVPDSTAEEDPTDQRPGASQLFQPVDHWEFSNDLGQQVRSLRQSRGLTLETVAQRSGISIGALSQLERGKGNPAFFTVIKIAHALEVPLTTLLQADTKSSPVVRADERRPLAPHFFEEEGVESELLTPDLDRQLQVAQYKLPAGASTQSTPFSHHGEEFITVLVGTVTVGLDRVEHELNPGDSISYPGTTPHWFANSGTTVAELLFCCTPPTF